MEAKKHITQAKRSVITPGGGQVEVAVSQVDLRIQEIIGRGGTDRCPVRRSTPGAAVSEAPVTRQ